MVWRRPANPFVKLNTDASVLQGRAYGGGLLRDHKGRLIFVYYKEFGEANVVLVERFLLLYGLQICKNRMVDNLLVEVDSVSLVRLVTSKMVSKWPLCNVLRRIRALLWGFPLSVTHIFREANTSADRLVALRSSPHLFCTSL